MAIVTPLSFSPNGEYFAYSNSDGTLKIWETATATLKQEYTPSAHLSASCTCLSWGSIKDFGVLDTPKKRKKKRRASTNVAELELIALGTTSGDILVFSPAKGDLHTQLIGHTGPVSSICWSSQGNRLFSSSHDQNVIEWDVRMSAVTRKWKADKTAISSVCLCHTERHLLTAGRTIKVWDLDTLQVIQTFTGHATEVFQLISVDCQKCEDKAAMNGDSLESSYLFSAAAGDRLVNAWQISSRARDKNALATFSLPEEPVHVNFRSPSQSGQTFLLTVVLKSGHVVIFENQLNGHRKKPLSPSVRLQVVSKSGAADDLPRPISVLCAKVKNDAERTVVLAYGTFLKPSFETLVYQSLEPDTCLEREDTSRTVMKLQQTVSKVKTPDMSQEVTFLAPGHMAPSVPTTAALEARKEQRKRKKSVDLTMEDRMNAISIDKPSTSHGSKHPPKADALATLLAQGLKSQDQKILTNVIQRRDEALIRNTVRKLPLTLILPLVQELARRMHSHAQSGAASLRWVRVVLTFHASYLMSYPGLMDTVSGMYAMMESRNTIFNKLSQLHGKLDLVLSQISSQEIEEDLDDVQHPLLTFQDESSDSEFGMDAAIHDHTESEDSWDELSAADEEEESAAGASGGHRTVSKRKNSDSSSEVDEVQMESDSDG